MCGPRAAHDDNNGLSNVNEFFEPRRYSGIHRRWSGPIYLPCDPIDEGSRAALSRRGRRKPDQARPAVACSA